jgi:ATP-dependent Clp protease protease subunit
VANGQPAQAVAPTEVYGLFAGLIDQSAVQRFHNAISIASAGSVMHAHVLFQSSGGVIGDGISLYNLFKACPFDLTLYNVGSICSIGVVAFLGAKYRKISKYGSFMIHRAYINPSMATSDRLIAAADQMIMDDARIEGILKQHLQLPKEKWEAHQFSDVWISADDAISYGLGHLGEFSPPLGTKIFNVWPPQS